MHYTVNKSQSLDPHRFAHYYHKLLTIQRIQSFYDKLLHINGSHNYGSVHDEVDKSSFSI